MQRLRILNLVCYAGAAAGCESNIAEKPQFAAFGSSYKRYISGLISTANSAH